MKNADMPAMPMFSDNAEPCIVRDPDTGKTAPATGLTKREIMAMYAMQGQLASLSTAEVVSWLTSAMNERGIDNGYPEKLIAINAVNYADALLIELEKPQ